MMRLYVDCPDAGGNRMKFVFHKESTFGNLKTAAASHFKKDPRTLQLYMGDDLLCLPHHLPISSVLKSEDALTVKGSCSNLSSDPTSRLNGGQEALQVALSQDDGAISLANTTQTTTTICAGTISQYSTTGGSSACTSICLVAAHRLLNSDMEALNDSQLDEIVLDGVRRHNEHGLDHTGIEDLWGLSVFSDIHSSLKLHQEYQGHLDPSSGSNGFLPVLLSAFSDLHSSLQLHQTRQGHLDSSSCSNGSPPLLQQALECAADSKVAILLIKPPETVLCLSMPHGFFLFDSHGQNHDSVKRVYLKRFGSVKELASALLTKYPPHELGDDQSIYGDMYNSFEAHPFTPLPSTSLSKGEGLLERPDMAGKDGFDEASIQQANSKTDSTLADCIPAAPLKKDDRKLPAQENSPSRPPFPSDETASLFERGDFEDPISREIMADPVKCTDGYTYERENIERYFRSRIEAEEERLQQTQAQGRQQEEAANTCCGAQRRIELTSPLTGEVLESDVLLPDKNLERTIVRLVESKALDMPDEEIREWTELREKKRINDHNRVLELRASRANELLMEEQAVQAEARRRAEAGTTTTTGETDSTNGVISAESVRVDRNMRIESERLATTDTGLSVSLCEKGDMIPVDYITASSQLVRCMVACCAARVDSERPRWCARCGRIVCQDCLKFGVTDISVTKPKSLHDVCSECVVQVLDAMDSSDIRCVQTRDIIRRINLQQDSARRANAAATAQDQVVRYETNERYQTRLEGLRREIQTLQGRRDQLEHQIQKAIVEARTANQDECTEAFVMPGSSVVETEMGHISLDQLKGQYDTLVANAPPSDDEDAQLQYYLSLSDMESRLERAQISHAESESIKEHASIARGTVSGASVVKTEMSNISLEGLKGQYDSLVASGPPVDDEAAQVQYYISLSDLENRLERAQIGHATMGQVDANSNSNAISLFLDAVEKHTRRRFMRKQYGRASKTDLRRLRELSATLSRKETSGISHSVSYRKVLGEFREQIDHLPPQCATMYSTEISAAKAELTVKEQQSLAMTFDPVKELLHLRTVDVSSLSDEEQIEHAMRLSGVQDSVKGLEQALLRDSTNGKATATQIQDSANEKPASTQIPDDRTRTPSTWSSSIATLFHGVGSLVRSFYPATDSQSEEKQVDLEECRARLEAIGKRDTDWTLPLGLEYPTQSMEQQLEILQNTLELRLVDSQRRWEQELSLTEEKLVEETQALEDTVQTLVAEASSAEAAAAQERAQLQERRRQRALERQRQEAQRREEERRRQDQLRRAQAEAEALRERHEVQTREAFASARGGRGQATTFGGYGDLRMCGRCKAGPFENRACSDLQSHNGTEGRNRCPNCNWFNANWRSWPYFDGVYGPH